MIKALVLDIEGTTTSIDFVHKTLFPYSLEKIPGWITDESKQDELKPLFAEILSTLKQESHFETSNLSDQLTQQLVTETLMRWVREDRKHPALKKIQGFIWQLGYEKGEIKGHIYPEVPLALKRWNEQNLKVGIYSSGSVLAQKLLFKYSEAGDLTPYLSFHFDTQVGNKREVLAYQKIAKELGFKASEIHFLSDIPEELLAAQVAGFKVTQVLRSGTSPHPDFEGIKDFSSLYP